MASTLDRSERHADESRQQVPCLTIASHPDLRRVGDRAWLPSLWTGADCQVSRLHTDFVSPNRRRATPLGDPYVSRRPWVLRRGPSRGSVELLDTSGQVQFGHERRADGQCLVDAEELQRGLPIVIADRVLLWLHATQYLDSQMGGGIEGTSEAVESLRRAAVRVASLPYPVLIRGETGVGKELVARALHQLGPRATGPFHAVNMATLAEGTAPSLLFGHQRGAFTGAAGSHIGLFERADRGTLFLDEIGATPPPIQPMLLRVLEEGRVLPLGAQQERAVDVRVIAATDAPLETMTGNGAFSAPLQHRLSGYELHVPPLRERPLDIPCLFACFVEQELATLGAPQLLDDCDRDPPLVQPELVLWLMQHSFAGNARELRNLARRAAVAIFDGAPLPCPPRAADDGTAGPGCPPRPEPIHLPAKASVSEPPPSPGRVSRQALRDALRAHDWSPERAAEALNLPKSTVHYLMRRDPEVRRATDFEDEELLEALRAADHDVDRAAAALSVSRRALAMTLRRRGLLGLAG